MLTEMNNERHVLLRPACAEKLLGFSTSHDNILIQSFILWCSPIQQEPLKWCAGSPGVLKRQKCRVSGIICWYARTGVLSKHRTVAIQSGVSWVFPTFAQLMIDLFLYPFTVNACSPD